MGSLMQGIAFEWTVSLGQLATVVIFVLTVAGAFWRLSARFAVIETKVDAMWQIWLNGVKSTAHAQGMSDERDRRREENQR